MNIAIGLGLVVGTWLLTRWLAGSTAVPAAIAAIQSPLAPSAVPASPVDAAVDAHVKDTLYRARVRQRLATLTQELQAQGAADAQPPPTQ